MKLVISLLLFIVAAVLIVALFPISIIFSIVKGIFRRRISDWYESMVTYWYDMAYALDKFGNVFIGPLFNTIMIKTAPQRLLFGNPYETISSCLGRNMIDNNLTILGKALCWVLDTLDEDLCIKAAKEFMRTWKE